MQLCTLRCLAARRPLLANNCRVSFYITSHLRYLSRGASTGTGDTTPDQDFFRGPRYLKFLMDGGLDLRTIKDTQEKSGTQIRSANKGVWYPFDGKMRKVVTISGEAENVISAFTQLQPEPVGENEKQTFLVPRQIGPALIGKDGENISEFRKKNNAMVNYNQVRGSVYSKVFVEGKRQAVLDVVKWLLKSQENHYQDWRNDLMVEVPPHVDQSSEIFLMLSPEAARMLVGKGGSTMGRIQKEFWVNMNLDSSRKKEEQQILKISGAMGDVHAVHAYIVYNFVNRTSK
eukprot:TRINITY_DN95102_c0_g1_i1.p2 TRINITY_DN95102_c0_g1~~TRINITY_DN95102_c0_g1_i1.p2  ORF type:complete len:288 (-),score=61.69 TRINITY_DN95102_c0_g1_i1:71-934(-)